MGNERGKREEGPQCFHLLFTRSLQPPQHKRHQHHLPQRHWGHRCRGRAQRPSPVLCMRIEDWTERVDRERSKSERHKKKYGCVVQVTPSYIALVKANSSRRFRHCLIDVVDDMARTHRKTANDTRSMRMYAQVLKEVPEGIAVLLNGHILTLE